MSDIMCDICKTTIIKVYGDFEQMNDIVCIDCHHDLCDSAMDGGINRGTE